MSKKFITIIALLPLIPFGFPHREGQTLKIDEDRGREIIEAGYAKEHDTKAEKAAAKVAELEKDLVEANTALAGLAEDAPEADRQAAEKAVADAEAALEKAKK